MAGRYVTIWFPYLETDWFELRKPELKTVPFVLCAPAHGRMLATAVNVVAAKAGIRKGMTLADARATLPSLLNFDAKPDLPRQLLERIAEWCIRFTPVAAPDPPDGIILDASGCAHLWDGDEAYVKDIIDRLAQRGYHVKAAMADTIGAAWGVVRFSGTWVIQEGRQLEALRSLPPEALRLDGATCARLHKLGLKSIQDFISFPASSLRRRFGPLLLQRLHQALGSEQEFFEPIQPLEPYQERLPCIEPIVTRTGIEIALQRLLAALCHRLQKESKGLRTAYFRGHRVDNQVVGIQISTSRASHNITHLSHLFQLKLSLIEPGLGIELFVLEATKVEDHTAAQQEFWKQGNGIANTRIAEFVDRIKGHLGEKAIQRFLPAEHYLPERSIQKVISLEEQPATEWITDAPRPLELLPEPQLIEVTAPVPDYPPMIFKYKGKIHKVVRADGPERIEAEWSVKEEEPRDYYAVGNQRGKRFWIFRSGHYDADKKPLWFIHGFFA